jgi:hypothetical protein
VNPSSHWPAARQASAPRARDGQRKVLILNLITNIVTVIAAIAKAEVIVLYKDPPIRYPSLLIL